MLGISHFFSFFKSHVFLINLSPKSQTFLPVISHATQEEEKNDYFSVRCRRFIIMLVFSRWEISLEISTKSQQNLIEISSKFSLTHTSTTTSKLTANHRSLKVLSLVVGVKKNLNFRFFEIDNVPGHALLFSSLYYFNFCKINIFY